MKQVSGTLSERMSSPTRHTRSFTGSACFLSLLKFCFRWDMSFERSSILSVFFFTALGRDCVYFWPHFKLSLKSYFYKSTGSPVTQTLAEGGASRNDHGLHDKKIRFPWKTHTCTLHVKQTSAGKFTCVIIYLLLNLLDFLSSMEPKTRCWEDVHAAC